MEAYDHKIIEKKWQEIWDKTGLYETAESTKAPKFYVLDMFPYPSGEGLHVGHPKGYIATDVVARMKTLQGYNVLHPMGWDAFGLPAENYAIKNEIHPKVSVDKNITTFKKQLKIIGFSYDWSREINTTDPAYYKWTQWIFIQMFKKGLAYESNEPVIWCPSCKTTLANEDLEDGKCERCGTEVIRKPMRQWVLKITDYADRLLKDLDSKDLDWETQIKEQQKNWIGRSEGTEISFAIKGQKKSINVFTTRVDTIFGCTYVLLAPEHKLIDQLRPSIKNWKEVEGYLIKAQKKSDLERTELQKDKTGVKLEGLMAINPFNKEEIPIFIADYVLGGYGTGAVMAVPAHDNRDSEFARKYDLPIKEVIIPRVVDKHDPPKEGAETIFRRAVQVILVDPKNDKVLALKWKKFPWTTFITGGIEGDESEIEAAKRETFEETGYQDIEYVRTLGGQVESHFYANHKGVNRKAHFTALVFKLKSDKKKDISAEESSIHELAWMTWDELHQDKNVKCSEYDIWLDRYFNKEHPFVEDGVLIDSGEFTELESREARKKMTTWLQKEKLGEAKVNYKMHDWVFSRQRYWGEPIPIIHCEKCAFEKYKKDAKLTLNFYYEEVWEDLKAGRKTLETRALNPDEQGRYFGNANVGDILHFNFKDKKTKRITEEKLFKIKTKKIYSAVKEIYDDKLALSKLGKKHYSSLKELEADYSYTSNYLDRIKSNGLIAWEVEPVTLAIPVPENELPVKLPEVESYEPAGTGESPLAGISDWVNTTCPKCGGGAKRETNTMPQWAGSSWYYLRYIDPSNDKNLVDSKKEKEWMPVDLYVGGAEHATRHLIYARFWHKFLYDIGVASTKEPFQKLVHVGIINASDGRKMSKRWGNVINPDEMVNKYGADSLRVYEMFMGPFTQSIAWSTDGVKGARRFLERIYKYSPTWLENETLETESQISRTIKKVTEDITGFRFNTAIATLMTFVNHLYENNSEGNAITRETLEKFLVLLSPFAPHLAEELWEKIGNNESIFKANWPVFDSKLIVDELLTVAVQINGKIRDQVLINKGAKEVEVLKLAQNSEKAAKYLNGAKIVKVVYVPDKLLSLVIK